jgi:hypothetical protein
VEQTLSSAAFDVGLVLISISRLTHEMGAPCFAWFAKQPALSEAEGWDSTVPSLLAQCNHAKIVLQLINQFE